MLYTMAISHRNLPNPNTNQPQTTIKCIEEHCIENVELLPGRVQVALG